MKPAPLDTPLALSEAFVIRQFRPLLHHDPGFIREHEARGLGSGYQGHISIAHEKEDTRHEEERRRYRYASERDERPPF